MALPVIPNTQPEVCANCEQGWFASLGAASTEDWVHQLQQSLTPWPRVFSPLGYCLWPILSTQFHADNVDVFRALVRDLVCSQLSSVNAVHLFEQQPCHAPWTLLEAGCHLPDSLVVMNLLQAKADPNAHRGAFEGHQPRLLNEMLGSMSDSEEGSELHQRQLAVVSLLLQAGAELPEDLSFNHVRRGASASHATHIAMTPSTVKLLVRHGVFPKRWDVFWEDVGSSFAIETVLTDYARQVLESIETSCLLPHDLARIVLDYHCDLSSCVRFGHEVFTAQAQAFAAATEDWWSASARRHVADIEQQMSLLTSQLGWWRGEHQRRTRTLTDMELCMKRLAALRTREARVEAVETTATVTVPESVNVRHCNTICKHEEDDV